MFDQEKLVAVIAAYKKYFPNHWKDEKYKWEAIQSFQEHWNISAENLECCYMQNRGSNHARLQLCNEWK